LDENAKIYRPLPSILRMGRGDAFIAKKSSRYGHITKYNNKSINKDKR
jgi:hypothetical protein